MPVSLKVSTFMLSVAPQDELDILSDDLLLYKQLSGIFLVTLETLLGLLTFYLSSP